MEKILARALGQDVSKLAAQEKRRRLARLLARLAHEGRNPLSSPGIHVQLREEDWQEATTPVRADSPQFTQALVNLVINALQAVERNGRVAATHAHGDFIPPKVAGQRTSNSACQSP